MPKVLLIRNYAPDKQASMLRFADMLERGLRELGWEVDVVEPPVRIGKGYNTTQGKGKWLGYVDKYILAGKYFDYSVAQSKPDIVHICDHSNSMYLPLFGNRPRLITCHDLLAVRSWLGEIPGERKSFTGGLQQKWIFNRLRHAPHVACVSQATEADLFRLAPETKGCTTVIPNGLNHPYAPLGISNVLERLSGVTVLAQKLFAEESLRPFLLHVGNNAWYKNRAGALAIYRELLQKQPDLPHALVMAGPPPDEALLSAAADLGERILFLEWPDNDLLEALYSAASCFLFPSLAEGFGWPPIEAQACGCPIAVSDIEPLKSNCGDAAVTFDPHNPTKAAEAILPILTNSARAQEAGETGLKNAERFTARRMVSAYVELYQQILDEDSASG